MKQITVFKIKKESHEDMMRAGRFNPCLEISVNFGKPRTHKISAGYDDDIVLFRAGDEIYALSSNHCLGYIGMELFDNDGQVGQIFLESWEIEEIFGTSKPDSETVAEKLSDYICDC